MEHEDQLVLFHLGQFQSLAQWEGLGRFHLGVLLLFSLCERIRTTRHTTSLIALQIEG